ncbi:hypothetical protein C8J57DRAFT_1296622 [Mycena rebaudengoi]|nr:hypothetical protein C8J57DRAFT_1296622 [Mycena rebaudengoi]
MAQNGFDYKALRMNTAPAANNPPFSMLQRPTNLRKPFAFVQTQSRHNTENSSIPPTQIPSSSRRQVDAPRMKQEPKNDHNSIIPKSIPPSNRSEPKIQSHSNNHKLRTFAMMTPAYDEHASHQPLGPPQYSSSPKLSAFEGRTESRGFSSQEPPYPPSVPKSRSPSLQYDPEFDVEDADLSQLMNKRLRDAKIYKSQLAEQCLATSALESRLAEQTASNNASELSLKRHISELEARDMLRQEKAEEQVRDAKAATDAVEKKLEEATTRITEIRAAAKKRLDQLGSNYTALEAFMDTLKSEYVASQDVVKRMSEELLELRQRALNGAKAIEDAESSRRGAETRALIEELQSDRTSAHQVIDMLRDKLHLLSAQIVEARERITELETLREERMEGLQAKVEEFYDRLLQVSRSMEEKETQLGAFREEKFAWEWELKDKCARISSLQGLQVDVVTLQEEKMALECQVKEKSSCISALQGLQTELVAVEKQKSVLECEIREHRAKIVAAEALQNETVTELAQSQDLLREQDAQLAELRVRLESVEARGTQTAARLLQSQDVVRERDARFGELQAQLKSVDADNTQLRASLQASQTTATGLDKEVRAANLREAVLEEKNRALEEKSQERDATISALHSAARTRDEELRQANSQSSLVQDRFDSQTLTLKLTKEQCGDLQERLVLLESSHVERLLLSESSHVAKLESVTSKLNIEIAGLQEKKAALQASLQLVKEQCGDLQERLTFQESSHTERLALSESSHATKFESVTGKLNIEIAVLQEHKASLQASLSQALEDATSQRAAFVGASVDYEKKLANQEESYAKREEAHAKREDSYAKQEESHAKREEVHVKMAEARIKQDEIQAQLLQSEQQRAIFAERDAAEAKRMVEELTQRAESGRATLEDVKKKLRDALARENVGVEDEVVVLRARIEDAEAENERLQHRERILYNRYQAGDLSDAEKSFVNTLMQMSQGAHEQEIVAKEHELRRRENMITSLQTKIDTLESTVARLLNEKGKEDGTNTTSMVNLKLWMSSSPRSAEKKAAIASTSALIRAASPTGAIIVPESPPVTRSSRALKPAVRSTDRSPRTFAAVDEDDEPLTDSDDDMPLSTTLGKRPRTPAVAVKAEETSRPARRARVSAPRKTEPEQDKKMADGGVKSKQRKRR